VRRLRHLEFAYNLRTKPLSMMEEPHLSILRNATQLFRSVHGTKTQDGSARHAAFGAPLPPHHSSTLHGGKLQCGQLPARNPRNVDPRARRGRAGGLLELSPRDSDTSELVSPRCSGSLGGGPDIGYSTSTSFTTSTTTITVTSTSTTTSVYSASSTTTTTTTTTTTSSSTTPPPQTTKPPLGPPGIHFVREAQPSALAAYLAERQLTVLPSAIPTYASSCNGSIRYSSACSCIGVSASTLTAATPTTTITVTVPATATVVQTVIETDTGETPQPSTVRGAPSTSRAVLTIVLKSARPQPTASSTPAAKPTPRPTKWASTCRTPSTARLPTSATAARSASPHRDACSTTCSSRAAGCSRRARARRPMRMRRVRTGV
jgi:hypothetical protein